MALCGKPDAPVSACGEKLLPHVPLQHRLYSAYQVPQVRILQRVAGS